MTFIVLAAGKGIRANSAKLRIPKVLLKGNDGVSLLVKILEQNKKYSSDKRLNIVMGFLFDQIVEEIESYRQIHYSQDINLILNSDYERGVITSLYKGIQHLDEDVVILNGDTYYSANIYKTINTLEKTTLLVVPKQLLPDAVKVETKDTKIMRVGKNLSDFSYISTGCLFLAQAHLKKAVTILENLYMDTHIEHMIWHQLINFLVDRGEDIFIKEVKADSTFEVDTQEDYKKFVNSKLSNDKE